MQEIKITRDGEVIKGARHLFRARGAAVRASVRLTSKNGVLELRQVGRTYYAALGMPVPVDLPLPRRARVGDIGQPTTATYYGKGGVPLSIVYVNLLDLDKDHMQGELAVRLAADRAVCAADHAEGRRRRAEHIARSRPVK